MDIVIVANFTGNFSESDNGRFLYLANMLCKDNKIEIITSSFQHEEKKQRVQRNFKWPFKITFIEEPGYPRNVCLKRFQSHYKWGKNVERYLKKRKKPDVIYCAIPSLTGPNLVAKYCEKEKIRFVIDVQDLWPEAFQMVLNIPILSNVLFGPFNALANGIYKRADAICAVSNTYCQRAKSVNSKCTETTTVFLGTELTTFDRYATENRIAEKPSGEIWLGYCGTLGTSYDLPIVFKAMKVINIPSLRFIIMGDGPRKDEFRHLAEGLNVTFTGLLNYRQMCGMLQACDIVVNPIVGTSAATIINKHADYAASGKPVINTQKSEEYRKLIELYQMGFNCSDVNELSQRLKQLVRDEALRIQLGKNARNCAERMFDRKITYQNIVRLITDN